MMWVWLNENWFATLLLALLVTQLIEQLIGDKS